MASYAQLYASSARKCAPKLCSDNSTSLFNGVGRSFKSDLETRVPAVNSIETRVPLSEAVDDVHEEFIRLVSTEPTSPDYGLVEITIGGRYFFSLWSNLTSPETSSMANVLLRRIRAGEPEEMILFAASPVPPGPMTSHLSASIILDVVAGDKFEVAVLSVPANVIAFPNLTLSIHSI